MRPHRTQRKRALSTDPTDAATKPGVSVLICAHNEAENLTDYLQSVLLQDYPTFEVIVVDDGSMDNTRSIMEQYHRQDSRIHLTFVPAEARVMSTKKLGITLAAKAAKYDYLVLTDADCQPASKNWLSRMVAPFIANPETEIVLGYGAYFEKPTLLNRLIQYDTLFNALHFLGRARSRMPYMGVGRNLAYKKDLFFRSGGFTDQMTVRSGDDDLFINKVATRRNTAIVVHPEATTWSIAKPNWEEWWLQKRRHLSVSPMYNTRSKLHLSLEPVTRGLFYLVLILTFVLGSFWVQITAAVLWFTRILTQALCLNINAYRLRQRGFSLGLIVWDIVLPILTFTIMSRRKNYIVQHW